MPDEHHQQLFYISDMHIYHFRRQQCFMQEVHYLQATPDSLCLDPMDDPGLPLQNGPDKVDLGVHNLRVAASRRCPQLLSNPSSLRAVHQKCAAQNVKLVVLQAHVVTLGEESGGK